MAFYYPWYEKSDWTYDKISDIAAPAYSGGGLLGQPPLARRRRHLEAAARSRHPNREQFWFGGIE
jgi:hypothetical protein